MEQVHDLIIVGAGPAGLAASIYAQERQLKILVLEANIPGGQLVSLYPEKHVYDYPGFSQIKAKDLALKMTQHVQSQAVKILTEITVTKIELEKNFFVLTTDREMFQAKSVILATGMGHCQPKKLGVTGEKEFTQKGVWYQKLPEKIAGKRVVVVGGGDTALETAVAAGEKGATVVVVHRKNSFRALEKTVAKAKSLSIPFYLSSQVTSIKGSDRVESVEITNQNGNVRCLSIDYVVVCIGVELNSQFLASVGVNIASQAVVVDTDMQTTVTGIFACGDIVIPAGKYKRISIAVGSAATAINGVYQYLKNPYWMKKL